MTRMVMAAAMLAAMAAPAMAQDAQADRDARAQQMFERMDSNGDGMVSRAEWDAARAAMAGQRGKGGRGEGRARVDADGDGQVTAAEWEAAGRPAERFAMLDSNGDGVATREEMIAARKAYQAQRAQ